MDRRRRLHAIGVGPTRVGVPAAIVLPVRCFSRGKSRLSGLGRMERAELLQRTAEAVVRAAGSLPVVVVSGSAEVRAWAASFDLAILDDPGSLNLAAELGVRWGASLGARRVVVAHADLPLVKTLAPVIGDGTQPIVTAVPCHRDDGTPVLSVPGWADFRFSYGPGSFRRRAAEARRLRLGLRVVRNADLAYDIDLPDDLHVMRRRGGLQAVRA